MQMLEMSPAAAAATMLKDGMSLTEMYSKYVEMSDAWRQERSDKKRVQGYLDTILEELERKAPLINEQKQEYERVMRSHDALAKRLEDAMHERAALDATIGKARSDAQRAAREKRSMLFGNIWKPWAERGPGKGPGGASEGSTGPVIAKSKMFGRRKGRCRGRG